MSGSQSSTEEKSLPPTKKKLLDARRKGKIATSRDFIGAAGTVAGLGYVILRGPALMAAIDAMITDASAYGVHPLHDAMPALISRAFWNIADFTLPLILLTVLCVVAASMVTNQGFVLAGEPLAPDLTRLDPAQGFGRIVSQRNLINALGIVFKFSVIALVVTMIIRSSLTALFEIPACGLHCMPVYVRHTFGFLLTTVALLFITLGGLDIVLQRFLFWQEMHMTRTERKRERKDSEGDISSKRARKQTVQASMHNQARMGLENAAFVIYGEEGAIAMAYSAATPIPTLVARAGIDAAAIMVEEAGEIGLPCVDNPVVAAQVATKMQLGEALPKALFVPVIECMRRAGIL